MFETVKGSASVITLISIFLLSGCGQDVNSTNSEANSPVESVVEHIVEEAVFSPPSDKTENPESVEVVPAPLVIPVNRNAEDIYLSDHIYFVPPCVSDGENLYFRKDALLGDEKPGLYVMPVGGDEIRLADIDIPVGMDIAELAIDAYGNLHLLIQNRSDEILFIRQYNADLQVEKEIDIAEYTDEFRKPNHFLVNRDGTYYIHWKYQNTGLIVDNVGKLLHKFSAESLGLGWVTAAGVGSDDEFYLVHDTDDMKPKIARFDIDSLTVEIDKLSLELPEEELFTLISVGIDTELLLYSETSGVWVYDIDTGILENRIPLSVNSWGYYSQFYNLAFLPDGRLLLATTVLKNNEPGDENFESWLFKYIPTDKTP